MDRVFYGMVELEGFTTESLEHGCVRGLVRELTS